MDYGFNLKKNGKNVEVRELLSLQRSGLQWFGHVEHKDEADWLKWCMKMEIEGTHQRGCPMNT